MKKIREILLTQYIGAVAIGLIMAQAIFAFVGAFVQAGATYITLRQSKSIFAQTPEFSWTSFVMTMITVALYAAICFFSIRWLYTDEISPNVKSDEPELPQA